MKRPVQVFLNVAPCLRAMLGDLEEGISKLQRDISNSAAPDITKRP
jgi:hypothetical protein